MSEAGGLRLLQYATPPIAYLDHWALMEIAEQHADRFIDALQRRGGTLALSWVNFLEISETEGETTDRVAALLGRVFPHVVFLDTEVESVVTKENEMLAGRRKGAPFLHDEWLREFFKFPKTSLNPLDPEEFVRYFRSADFRSGVQGTETRARTELVRLFTEAREKARRDAVVRRRFESPLPRGDPRVPPTRFAFIQGMKYLVRGNQNLKSGNHLRDFWHTIVPISYSRYVVLDKNWREAAVQIQKALMRRGLLTHEAYVYSLLPEFLWHLEREWDYRGP